MFKFIARFLHKGDRNVVEIPLGLKGKLYFSPMPSGPYDCLGSVLKQYKIYNVKRVTVLVTDDEIKRKARRNIWRDYENAGIETDHFPIPDLTSPVAGSLEKPVAAIVQFLRSGRNHALHCNAGVGRTCLVGACIIRAATGCSPEEAILQIKEFAEINITTEQRRLIERFKVDQAQQTDPAPYARQPGDRKGRRAVR